MGSIMGIVLYMAFFFGIMWLLIIRPQKKRDRETQSMQDSIKVGDSVLLNTGLYGKVVDVVNDLFIIEMGLNKSVRVPVKKAAVAGVGEPNLSIAKAPVVVEETYDDEDYDDEYDDEDYEDEE